MDRVVRPTHHITCSHAEGTLEDKMGGSKVGVGEEERGEAVRADDRFLQLDETATGPVPLARSGCCLLLLLSRWRKAMG